MNAVARASERLHFTSQTLSGQLWLLAVQTRVQLETDGVRAVVIELCGRDFSLRGGLDKVVRKFPGARPQVFKVGVADTECLDIKDNCRTIAAQPESVC